LESKRVLLVDDHAPTRVLIRALLESEKAMQFSVVEAATATECLKAHATQGTFDLILLDVNLPDMDGYELCRRLRLVDDVVPIVFVTAKGDLKDYSAGLAAGGDSYLVKSNLKSNRAALRAILNLFSSVQRRRPEPGV
jgi:CheY-like chemotaxis protein